MREKLLRLDDARFDNPRQALQDVKDLIQSGKIQRKDCGLAYGVLGSCFRMNDKLFLSAKAITEGIRCAEKDHHQSVGDLLQRYSVLVSDYGQLQAAINTSMEATAWHLEFNDQLGVAKTLVDRGEFHFYLNEDDRTIRSFTRALKYPLESKSPRHYVAALLGLSVAYSKLRDFPTARSYSARALDVRPRSYGVTALLNWQAGIIAHQEGELETAEAYLIRAFDGRYLTAVNLALVAVELVQVQLLQGNIRGAAKSAQLLAQHFDRLEENPVVEALAAELMRSGLAMRLSLRLVNRVRDKLEKERTRQNRAQSEALARWIKR